MGCNCGKPKCDGHCGVSPAVLQINNPSECVLFRKVEVPASMGTSVENPPKPGAYRNVLLYYKADGEAYLYSSDGIPTKITGTTSDYEILTNKPKINDVELVGDKSLADIGVTDAINNALEPYTPTSEFAEVAFTGDYEDLVNTPPKVVTHFYTLALGQYDVGDEVPIYNDEDMTDRTAYEQFADAVMKGPVQFNQQYDVGAYNIREIYLITADVEYDIGFSVEDTPGGDQRTEMLWNKGDSMPVVEYIRPEYTQVNADWNTTNTSSPAYIKNKPTLATVATSGSYDDLTDKPDIPSGPHIFYMWPPSEGNAAPIYHDYGRTDQVTLAQFTDAIASGPVQIYMEHDGHTFWIYYVDQLDAFIPDPPMVIGTLDVSFGLRSQNDLGVRRFYWQESDTAPIYDSYDPNQSDWNQTSSTRSSYIKNKPNLATVATSGSYNDLSDKPTIPAAQVNSDWNAASGVAQILNKPSLATVATSGSYNDLTDKPADFELVEMSYGESNAWAKFIAAYQGHKIVYCRVSSNADPSTGTQGRKAFMAYVNNAENPTEVEFQYVRSVSSKTASQPVDQVFVYKLTSANGGTWTVETRNMAPKLAAGTNTTVNYSNGTYTISATVPTPTVLDMTYDTTATTWTDTDIGITLQETPYGTFPDVRERIQTFTVPTPVFTNASTGSTLDAEGLYNLLETGADVVLNGVPVGVRLRRVNSTATFTVGDIVCDGIRLTKVGPFHIEDFDPDTSELVYSMDLSSYSATVSANAVGTTMPTLLPFAIRVYKRVTFDSEVSPDPQTEYAFEIQGTSYTHTDAPT